MAANSKEAQFDNTPEGWAKRLQFELQASHKAVRDWHAEHAKAN